MSITLLQERLDRYQCKNALEEENALKEISQEITLLALSRAGFFRTAAFQGGTCLRIMYGLERFSEDLDFALQMPNKAFVWNEFLNDIQAEFELYGFMLEIQDRSKANTAVKKTFLKANSLGNILLIDSARSINHRKKLRIKLEVDTNPPADSNFEIKYLDFPIPFSVTTQDPPSLFAGKCHALLCREYIKGRDWYDFIWYTARQVPVNFALLKSALEQTGPWQKQALTINKEWLTSQLKEKINQMDWPAAKQDVGRFVKTKDLPTLELWSKDFFLSRVEKLERYL